MQTVAVTPELVERTVSDLDGWAEMVREQMVAT